MELKVLGPIEVHNPDLRPLGGPVQRRALAMLALHGGRPVSVDQLVDGIWPSGDTPARADHNVKTYVHRLRAAIGADDRIETVGSAYRLHLDRDEFDVFRFEDLVADARAAADRGEPGRALDVLQRALELWRGRPYDEVADHDWARAEIARLNELRASAIEHSFQVALDAGRHTEVIGELTQAVGEEPFRERRRVQLALALYRSDRQAEALRAIREFRAELAAELGLNPSPELDELEHRILEHDPGLLPSSHRKHRLRGYELEEVIGEGAFSLVWRGVQPSLGRTVAVKQIRAELANQPDFVRRFETEAQTVATLEHPFIVPLYDYWREPDSAYLVMRYVPTGTLESEVLQGGLDDTRLRRLVEQVGSALHTAHRVGVIHRDVKSANVLIDGDDNFFLTDFGIAFTGSEADDELANALSTGSPAYASPEQLRRQSLDHRTDVYGFGITLFEASTGRLPFVDAPSQAVTVQRQLQDPVPSPSSVAPSVPAWVDEVVAQATAKNPSERYGSMAELVAAVPQPIAGVARIGTAASATVIGELVNPFKALRAFREADAADFHGRDRLVHRFLEVLAQPGSAGRLLAVVGPSGSGKSSAVRSGLLPKLRAGAVPGSDEWFITTMLPGSRPFEELESALGRVAVRQAGRLVEVMRGDERGIARAVNQILPDEESELVVVIDQFEELFTQTAEDERTRFLDGLLAAVREPRARLRVVATIRADFWDRPLRHPGLAARLETAAVTVSPLAAGELEAAIVEPVRRQGAAYEPGLVARIIADVGDQPGALPLLQYALTELFGRHVSGLIRTEAYDEIGGLTGALASRAEATFEALTAVQQVAARRLFGRLVTLGTGTEDTRRRVRVAEIGTDPATEAVVDAFGAARMLVFDVDPTTREPTAEIAHEALLRAWPRLRGWLDEDRDGIRIHRHLSDSVRAWIASDRDPGELYRGGRLDTARTWAADHSAELNDAERGFLDASVAAHDSEEAHEREHLERQVRSNRRLRVLASVAAVIALIAATAGALALQQRSRAADRAAEARAQADEAEEARQQAEIAQARADESAIDASQRAAEAEAAQRDSANAELETLRQLGIAQAAQGRGELERLLALAGTGDPADPSLSLLLAVEAQRFWALDRGYFPLDWALRPLDALHRALTLRGARVGALQTGAVGEDITVLEDGRRIVVNTADRAQLWDVADRALIGSWDLGVAGAESVFTVRSDAASDGSVIVVAGPEASIVIETGSSEPSRTIEHAVDASVVRVSPDGSKMATGFADGTVEVRPIGVLDEVTIAQWDAGISALAWHPDGAGLAVGTFDSSVTLWSPGTGQVLWERRGDVVQASRTNAAHGLLFRADGTGLVISTQDVADAAGTNRGAGERVIRVLDVETGLDAIEPIADRGSVRIAWMDDEESVIAAAALFGPIDRIDTTNGERTELGSKPGISSAFALLPDLGLLASPSGATVELRDLDGSGPLARTVPLADAQRAADGSFLVGAFSQDASAFVLSSLVPTPPHVTDLIDVMSAPEPFVAPDDAAAPFIVDGYGSYVLHISSDGITVRRGPDGPAEGPPIQPPSGQIAGLSLSPRGDRFAVTVGITVHLYDVGTGSVVRALDLLPQPEANLTINNSIFSPDGAYVHTYNGFAVARFDAGTGEMVWLTEDHGWAYPGPGDEWMITPDSTGLLTSRNPETRDPIGEPLVGHVGDVNYLDVAPGARRLVSGAADGTARVWDVELGVQLGRELPVSQSGRRIWSPDASLLALPRVDGNGYDIWNYDTDTWADIACDVAGRNLTPEEWEEFGPRTIEYRATCPQFPSGQ